MAEYRSSRFPASLVALICCAALLAACAPPRHAPVIERAPAAAKAARKAVPREPDWRPEAYTVQKGDTLYSIALEHGLDYRELAEWNGIADPNIIMTGRRLRLRAPQQAQTAPLRVPEAPPAAPGSLQDGEPPAAPQAREAAEDDEQVDWGWPVRGKMLAGFNDGGNAKGLDIAGAGGQPVSAAASGKVVYSGSGLRGYGKLIIIKHSKTYLSAYAHNSRILIKEGQNVAKGQKIAEMGDTDADQVKLHFEIRRLGKPVDPLKHLPN